MLFFSRTKVYTLYILRKLFHNFLGRPVPWRTVAGAVRFIVPAASFVRKRARFPHVAGTSAAGTSFNPAIRHPRRVLRQKFHRDREKAARNGWLQHLSEADSASFYTGFHRSGGKSDATQAIAKPPGPVWPWTKRKRIRSARGCRHEGYRPWFLPTICDRRGYIRFSHRSPSPSSCRGC